MIKAQFIESKGKTVGFTVNGHANYADSGEDIVCAGVSSAVMLTVNTITENFGVKAKITDKGEQIEFVLSEDSHEAIKLLEGFKAHLTILSSEYQGTIIIENMEV